MRRPLNLDPRVYQIASLTTLLTVGVMLLGFEFVPGRIVAVVVTALATQWLASRLAGIRFDARSALITALSLTLLLRTSDLVWAIAAALIAIGSKFVVRWRGKHIFNPANSALVVLMLVTDAVWVSSGQWGSAMLGATLVAALGTLVVSRARRAETPLAFIATFVLLVVLRAIWLGDPAAIVLHQLGNGALLVFTFFMISDPKTAPDHSVARLTYGAAVAVLAFVLETQFFVTAAPIWALAFAAPAVPLLDALLRATRYSWFPAARLRPLLKEVH